MGVNYAEFFDNICLTGHILLIRLRLGVRNYVYIISTQFIVFNSKAKAMFEKLNPPCVRAERTWLTLYR